MGERGKKGGRVGDGEGEGEGEWRERRGEGERGREQGCIQGGGCTGIPSSLSPPPGLGQSLCSNNLREVT